MVLHSTTFAKKDFAHRWLIHGGTGPVISTGSEGWGRSQYVHKMFRSSQLVGTLFRSSIENTWLKILKHIRIFAMRRKKSQHRYVCAQVQYRKTVKWTAAPDYTYRKEL